MSQFRKVVYIVLLFRFNQRGELSTVTAEAIEEDGKDYIKRKLSRL